MSDLYRIEINGLELKHPISEPSDACDHCMLTFFTTTLFVYPDNRVSYCISTKNAEIVRIHDKCPAFHPEDQRRIHWLIHTARSMT